MSRSTLMHARIEAATESRPRDRWLSLTPPPAPDISREHAERILARAKPAPMRHLDSAADVTF